MTFYHGTSSSANVSGQLLPSSKTGVLSERNRKRNLDRVFFTEDIGLAKIYAGRAVNSMGGLPEIFIVIDPLDAVCLRDDPGASVWHCESANCKKLT